MTRPVGALDTKEWRNLKHTFPDKMIYRIDTMFRGKPARWWQFSGDPPYYYFDNYWFAYAYAVKYDGCKNLQVKITRSEYD